MTPRQRPWNPDPPPFGNARGFDHVSVDVQQQIAERLGATVTRGALPPDLDAEQQAKNPDHELRDEREPFAAFTISHDGLSLTGEHATGRGHTSGYRGHFWLDRIGPDTLVFDLRPMTWENVKSYAIRGPMLNPHLPAGTIDTFNVDDLDGTMQTVADDYLAPYGGTAAQGY